jgi:hypothetical protein
MAIAKKTVRKATAKQKETAKKHGIRLTKTVGGKRVEKGAEQLKKEIAKAKEVAMKKKAKAKKAKASKRQVGASDRASDMKIKAKEAGERVSRKYSIIEYKTKDPKTGKTVIKKVRRRNANQFGKAEGGKKYTERRASKTDKRTWI